MHSVSIVIPAYNEERRLPATLEKIRAFLDRRQFAFAEILVVDDGSSDGTVDCVRSVDAVRLLQNPGNRGKGYSIRNGMLAARGEWRLFTDADLSSPIEELDKLFAAVERSGASVAIGSRALEPSLVGVHQHWTREYAGRLFNLTMRGITGLPYRDTQCGFKLYSAFAAERIFPLQTLDGFGFDVEDLVIARVLGIPVVEEPVRWNNVEGTRVGITQGLKSFLDPVRIRLNEAAGRYKPPSAVR